MPKYKVSRKVTITYSREIEAKSKKEAREMARDLGDEGAYDQVSGGDWRVKGEAKNPKPNYQSPSLRRTERIKRRQAPRITPKTPRLSR